MPLLKKKNILITAGSTRGYLDAVRYITNTSTGMLGREIALTAMSHGAEVTYIYGADSLFPVISGRDNIRSSQLRLFRIETNNDLIRVIRQELKGRRFDAVIHAMAVADYVPARTRLNKTPSSKKEWLVKLVKTPKVITIIRDLWPDAFLVGFKLEVNRTKDELVKIARRFLIRNKAGLVVANDWKNVSPKRHIAYLVDSDCRTPVPLKNKNEIAEGIIYYIEKVLR